MDRPSSFALTAVGQSFWRSRPIPRLGKRNPAAIKRRTRTKACRRPGPPPATTARCVQAWKSDKPGDCPKCGMALERNPAWSPPRAGQDDLHLPDAPRGAAGSSRRLPEVRHGAGTGNCRRRAGRRRRQRRIARHDAALLDQRHPHPARVRACDGAPHPRVGAAGLGRQRAFPLAAVRARHARGLVGGVAVLPPGLALPGVAPPQHVHPHRHRRGHRLRVQRRGDARAGPVPRHPCGTAAACPSTSRPPR